MGVWGSGGGGLRWWGNHGFKFRYNGRVKVQRHIKMINIIRYIVEGGMGRGWVPGGGFNYRMGGVGPWRQISVICRTTLELAAIIGYRGPGLWPIIVIQKVSECVLQEIDTVDSLGGRM